MREVIMRYDGAGEDSHNLTRVGELVRCGECKYQEKGINETDAWNLCGHTPWRCIPTTDNHYCGYGERKEDT